MQELETFIKLRGRERVLTVLVSGEPYESFPPQLRFDNVNGKEKEKEPLAADVRGEDSKAIFKRLNAEKLRILTPMLGVDYDDLKQRAKERKLKTILAAAFASLILLGSFTAYAIVQNKKITNERNSALISQSQYLSDASIKALNEGNTPLAIMLAKEALPENTQNPNRPLTDEAEYALRSALYQNAVSTGYALAYSISYENSSEYILRTNASDTVLSVYYNNGSLCRYDLATGALIETYTLDNKYSGACQLFDGQIAVYGKNFDYICGETLNRSDAAGTVWSTVAAENGAYFAYERETSRYSAGYKRDILSVSDIETRADDLDGAKTINGVCALNGAYSSGYSLFAVACKPDTDAAQASSLMIVSAGGEINARLNTKWESSGVAASSDGKIIFAVYSYDARENGAPAAELFNRITGKAYLSFTLNDFGGYAIAQQSFFPDGKLLAVRNEEDVVYIIDYIDGKNLGYLDTGAVTVRKFIFSADGKRIICACSDDKIRIYSLETFELAEEFEASEYLLGADILTAGNTAAGKDDGTVLITYGSYEIQVFRKTDISKADSGSVIRLGDAAPAYMGNAVFSPDDTLLAVETNAQKSPTAPGADEMTGIVTIYDTHTGEALWQKDGLYNYSRILSFSPDGSKVLYGNKYSELTVADALSGKEPGKISVKGVSDDGTLTPHNPLSAEWSADGKYLFVYSNDRLPSRLTLYDAEDLTEVWAKNFTDGDVSIWDTGGYNDQISFRAEWIEDGNIKTSFILCASPYSAENYSAGVKILSVSDGEVIESSFSDNAKPQSEDDSVMNFGA